MTPSRIDIPRIRTRFILTLGFILGFIRSPIPLMGSQTIHLTPQETSWVIPWGNGRDTERVWAYTPDFPNPEIRLKKGEPVRVVLRNRLREPTTVHWHGMLVENAMDGVPGLTQDAVQPGEEFIYEFTPNVAGSFMYHPHARTHEQVGRGLIGALIVEDENDPPVDRDTALLINDWRVNRKNPGRLDNDFESPHDKMMAGRIGDIVTINGKHDREFDFYRGERVRLRFINASNARILAFEIPRALNPRLIARDAYARPPAPVHSLTLGPGMRADVIIDIPEKKRDWELPAAPARGSGFMMRMGSMGDGGPFMTIRTRPSPVPLTPKADTPIPDPPPEYAWRTPSLDNAVVVDIPLDSAGMMGMMRRGGSDNIWSIRGQSKSEHTIKSDEPLITLVAGQTYIFDMENLTHYPHPMHLHGHVFQVLDAAGRPGPVPDFRDTVLIDAGQRMKIAFTAESSGNWAWHCHTLEHAASGMMSFMKVNG